MYVFHQETFAFSFSQNYNSFLNAVFCAYEASKPLLYCNSKAPGILFRHSFKYFFLH